MSKVSCKVSYAIGGFFIEFNGGDEGRQIYLKSNMYEAFEAYSYSGKGGVDNTDKPTELSHEEWAIAISGIMSMTKKSFSGKMMSFLESIGGGEETLKARKSIFWQLFEKL